MVAHHKNKFEQIKEQAKVYRSEFGIETKIYSKEEFNEIGHGGTEQYGAFSYKPGFAINPLKFVNGIAKYALSKKLKIFEHTKVDKIDKENADQEKVKNDLASIIIPVAADWKATDWLIANTFLQDRILKNSRDPVIDARIHAMTFYRSPKSLNTRFTRTKNLDKNIYNVESWLIHHGEKLRQRFSLKSYLFMNKLLSSTDITRDGKSFTNKISKIKSSIHLISVDSDIFFLPNEDRETYLIAKKNNLDITNHIIKSIHGHDAFLIETKQISDIFTKIF